MTRLRALVVVLIVGASATLAACSHKFADLKLRDRKVLFIGVDGLDFLVLKSMFDQGQMPRISALKQRGIVVPLFGEKASNDPYSGGLDPSQSWTTIATGVPAARPSREGASHAIRNITVLMKNGYEQLPVTTAHRRAPNCWDVLSAAGVKCAICGWWTTWPAEPVNGYMVSDRFFLEKFGLTAFGPAGRVDLPNVPESYRHGAKYLTWPDALGDELAAIVQPKLERPTPGVFNEVRQMLAMTKDPATHADLLQLEQSLRTDYAVKESLVALLKKDPSIHFAACYLDALDVACHLFWMHIAPADWSQHKDPSIRDKLPRDFSNYSKVIPIVAVTIDAMVGELVDAMGPDPFVGLATDHLLQPDTDIGNRDFSMNRLLEAVGLIVRGADGEIDWSRTRAFDKTNWPTRFIRDIALNFKGEWPQGFIPGETPQERNVAWRAVQEKLLSLHMNKKWKAPDGQVKNDLFWQCVPGPTDTKFVVYQALTGDITVALPEGPGGKPVELPVANFFPPRHTSARHREPGIFLLSFPGEMGERAGKRGIPIGPGAAARSIDLMPLLLGLYGIPCSSKETESPQNSDRLYWMLERDEAHALALSRVDDYGSLVRFDDPTSQLGARRAELKKYVESLGYSFDTPATAAVIGENGVVRIADEEETGAGDDGSASAATENAPDH